jgi:lysozyme
MTTHFLETDLTRDEGVRFKAYKDARGIWTIGIGHNIQADPSLTPQLRHLIEPGIDQATVDSLFAADVTNAESQLTLHLPWWTQLDDIRQDVLVNMTFNMGMATLLLFHDTLARIQAGDYVGAADAMLQSAWAAQVGERAQRLAAQVRSGVH